MTKRYQMKCIGEDWRQSVELLVMFGNEELGRTKIYNQPLFSQYWDFLFQLLLLLEGTLAAFLWKTFDLLIFYIF